jgi:DNA-binding NarL/FixJ family response regulator
MAPVDVEGMSVVLVAGRTLREQCLARVLEFRGIVVKTVGCEDIGGSLRRQNGFADLVIVDSGEQSCDDPELRTSFAHLRGVLPSVPIVVLSDREDWSAAVEALKLGARAYFPSSLSPDIFIETLRFVQKGGTFIPLEALVSTPAHRSPPQGAESRRTRKAGLTPTERRVLELLKTGQPNKVIARELDIQEATVKVHVRRIMKKLNAVNRTQAAWAAQQTGLFEAPGLREDPKQDTANRVTMVDLQRALRERDALNRKLLRRVERLERQLATATRQTPPAARTVPAAEAPPTAPPPGPPAPNEPQGPKTARTQTKLPAPGEVEVDQAAALEATLVQRGALLLPSGQAEVTPSFTSTLSAAACGAVQPARITASFASSLKTKTAVAVSTGWPGPALASVAM